MADNVIRVTGKGAIHVKPDVTRLEVALVSIHDSYDEAYEMAAQNTSRLASVMESAGLPGTLPKTHRLDIEKKASPKYDHYGHHVGQTFLGFELDHRVKIDLGMDAEVMSKVVQGIGRQMKQAEITIGHTVSDPRPHQLKMLRRAVTDARDKAQIMAEAGGCRLGAIRLIDYSHHEIHFHVQARQMHSAAEAMGCTPQSLDITPDDLVGSEQVNVEWELINEPC